MFLKQNPFLKRALAFGALLLIVFTFCFSIFGSRLANAQVAASVIFIDKVTIKFNGKTYTDVNPYDNTKKFHNHGNYKLNGKQSDGTDQIDINNFSDGNVSAKYTYYTPSGVGTTQNVPIDPTTLPNRFIDGYRIDADHLFLPVGIQDPGCLDGRLDDSSWFSGAPSEYFKRGNPLLSNQQPNKDYSPNQYDEYSPALGGGTSAYIETLGGGQANLNGFKTEGCTGDATPIRYGIQLANDGQIMPPPDVYPGAATPPSDARGGGGSSSGDDTLKCDASLLDDPLKWLLCPLVNGAVEGVQSLDNAITQELNINSDEMFGANANPGAANTQSGALYKAWSSFRTLALALLVIIALIMIISQAIGAGPFDAYTIRRVMPRLLIAVIGITLSWSLMKFAVDISNHSGIIIRSLIYAPFKGLGGQLDTGSLAVVILAGGGALFVFSILGVLSFALTAFLAVLIAFAVLIMRHMLIMFLVVIAPVAIIMSILPGTQRGWKIWYDYFFRALLIFPIIAAFIATGRAFAEIALLRGDTLGSLIAMVAYFAPYFLIPTAFRLAGGAIATIGGIANDRGRGAFDRLKGYRGKKAAENFQKSGNFSRFSDRNKLTRGLNTMTGAAFNPRSSLKGAEAIRAARQSGRVNQGAAVLENDATYKANQNDDAFLLALANRELATQKYNDALGRANDMSLSADERNSARAEADQRSRALSNANNVASRNSAGTRMAALQALAGTGYQFAPGEQGYSELKSTIESITGGDQGATSAAMNEAQYRLKGAGRLDLAGINHAAGLDIKGGIRKMGNYQRGQGKPDTYHGAAQAWLGSSSVDASTGKTFKDSGSVARGIEASLASGATTEADVAEYHGMLLRDLDSATDANKIEIQKQLDAMESVRMPGDAGDISRGGQSNLTARLAANRENLRRQSIDPSELDNT